MLAKLYIISERDTKQGINIIRMVKYFAFLQSCKSYKNTEFCQVEFGLLPSDWNLEFTTSGGMHLMVMIWKWETVFK